LAALATNLYIHDAMISSAVGFYKQVSSQATNHQKCVLDCAKSNSTVKNWKFSWLWCSWSASGFKSAGLPVSRLPLSSLLHLLINKEVLLVIKKGYYKEIKSRSTRSQL
jgi:hypothetical protein